MRNERCAVFWSVLMAGWTPWVFAGAGLGLSTDLSNGLKTVPTYYANSPAGIRPDLAGGPDVDTGPALRKFVDALPGVGAANANNLGQYIPVAVPDTVSYPGTDYYEIGIVEHAEQMHRDLVEADGVTPHKTLLRGYVQIETPVLASLRDAKGNPVSRHVPLTYPDGKPIKDVGGNPVYGVDAPHYGGPLVNAVRNRPTRFKYSNYLPKGSAGDLFLPVDKTLIGAGLGPDGKTAYTENRATVHLHGGDTQWISDGTPYQWTVPVGEVTQYQRGVSFRNVPDMPDPGQGSGTMYYPNGLSGRMLWYHDHTIGLTRLNVYAGELAPYILRDPVEQNLINTGVIPADEIPLIIQDKTFVPRDIVLQDAKWDTSHWGKPGDLWFPHVYETNQDPTSFDGTNPPGRWDWGPWFWPIFPSKYNLPTGVYGDVSTTPEAFHDTPVVNGTAYPTLKVKPKAYRLRVLNGCSDRMLNLGLYLADPTVPGPGGLTEPKMVPFDSTGAFPTWWGTPDGRTGGVPDPATAGPDLLRIGNEGGLLPGLISIPSTPINYEYNKRSVTILNVQEHGLWLGSAERGDVVVDFSQFAGKVLLLVNDAPAPLPAGDLRLDYYSNDPDSSTAGGWFPTQPGYGPNTRTIMQIVVDGSTAPAPAYDANALAVALPKAYAASQDMPVVPESAYNLAYNQTWADTYNRIFVGSSTQPNMSFNFNGGVTRVPVVAGGSYTAPPNIVFTGGGGYAASAQPALALSGITVSTGGRGYTSTPTVTITAAPGDPGTGAMATATINRTTGTVTAINLTNPGSGYLQLPTVTLSGGGVAAADATFAVTATVTGIQITSPGLNYTSAPQAVAKGGVGFGLVLGPVEINGMISLPVENKAIQELFDPVYGRMNATLGVELPYTSQLIQTTIPLGYLDPATDTIADGQTKIWKITHNGVDTHTVHFHLVNVQLINRVGWDGTVKVPYQGEEGWRETVKMNPLEDVYVAVRAKQPKIPFGVPQSSRLLDPSQPAGGKAGFAGIDPVSGNATTVTNVLANFGWEYVWHCHLLGHEENDFMRPFVFTVATAIPAKPVLTANQPVSGTVNLSWTDGTPWDPAAGNTPASSLANPQNEISYVIGRASLNSGGAVGAFAKIGTALANATSFTTSLPPTGTYVYQVVASNASGGAASNTVRVNQIPPLPAVPTNLSATIANSSSVNLAWTDASTNETGFSVWRAGNSGAAVQIATLTSATGTAIGGVLTYTDTSVVAGNTYVYTVRSFNLGGSSADSNIANVNFAVPATPTGLSVAPASATSANLSWTDASGNEASFQIWRSAKGGAAVQVGTVTSVSVSSSGGSYSFTNTGLTLNTAYTYYVVAVNVVGASPASSTVAITMSIAPLPPTNLTGVATGSGAVNLSWKDASTNETGFAVWRALNGAAPTKIGTVPSTTGATIGSSVTYADTGLTAGGTVAYYVTALNAAGTASMSSNTVSLTLSSPPVSPVGLTASIASSTSVSLSWTDQSNNETGFGVWCAANGGAAAQIATVTSTTGTATGGSISYNDITVTVGNTYVYTVTAINATGVSAASASASVNFVVPTAPTGVTAVQATTSTATISWSDASTNETSFQVWRAAGKGLATQVGTVTSTTGAASGGKLSYTDSGLTSGVTYSYTVVARNTVGASPSSSAANLTLSSPPVSPVGLTASIASSTSVGLSWMDQSNNETGFAVWRTANGGAATQIATVTSTTGTATGSSISYNDITVTAGNTYAYTVTAINAMGASAASGSASVNFVVPAAPTGVTAVQASTSTATISWSDASTNETSFALWRSTGGATPIQITSVLSSTGAATGGVLSFKDTRLTVGVSYTYYVQAVNLVGSSTKTPSARLILTSLSVPTAPSGLTATIASSTSVNLSWADQSSNETSFGVWRAVNGATAALIGTVTSTTGAATGASVTFTDKSTTAGNAYLYTVTAINAAGASIASSPVSISLGVPVAPGSASLTMVLVKGVTATDTATLNWVDNSGNETGFVIQRAINASFTQRLVTTNVAANSTMYVEQVPRKGKLTYYYRIYATNPVGKSSYSNVVSARVP